MIPLQDLKINPENWVKECWIASKKSITYDDEENEIIVYDKPVKYEFNYQPTMSDSEIVEFGEKARIMQKAVIPITFKDKFKEFDVAYLDGNTPKEETVFGSQANYRLLPPRNGNAVIIIYFEKLTGK